MGPEEAASGRWSSLPDLLGLACPPERSHDLALRDAQGTDFRLSHGRLREILAAFSLSEFGIGPGERVAVALEAGPELGLAILCLSSRACCMPLDPKVPPNPCPIL